jgi:hypothetical protein
VWPGYTAIEVPMRKAKMIVTIFGSCWLAAHGSDPKPNFTGEWKLIAEKSDFGPLTGPGSATARVRHDDPTLRIDVRQDDATATLTCATDGSEQKQCTGPVLGVPFPVTVTSRVNWEESSLVFVSQGMYSGGRVEVHDQWILSADGKTATIRRYATSPDGEAYQTIVLERQ